MKERVLIVCDDDLTAEMLVNALGGGEFELITTSEAGEGLSLARRLDPDVIIVDSCLDGGRGVELCQSVRSEIALSHIPIILLVANARSSIRLESFSGTIDDFILKEQIFRPNFSSLIRNVIARVELNANMNPLTGLPGDEIVRKRIVSALRNGEQFSVGYADIDNFKPFNDAYGFSRGDQVILMVARTLKNSLRKYGTAGDFLGHLGGDDFVLVGNPYTMRDVAAEAIRVVRQNAPGFYDNRHRQMGGIEGLDRDGNKRFFPFLSLTVAIVDIDASYVNPTPEQITRLAVKIKRRLKFLGGNTFGGYEVLLRN